VHVCTFYTFLRVYASGCSKRKYMRCVLLCLCVSVYICVWDEFVCVLSACVLGGG